MTSASSGCSSLICLDPVTCTSVELTVTAIHKQKGAAAVEFALTITMLLLMAVGIAGAGFLAWAQQRMSAMAGEGARVALLASYQDKQTAGASACGRVQRMMTDTALMAGVQVSCQPTETICEWTDVAGNPQSCLRLDLTGDVSSWPIFRMLGGVFSALSGDQSAEGYRLRAQAVIQIASN